MQPSIVFGLPSLHYDPDSLGCSRISGPAFIAELSWVQASLSRLTLGCPSPTLRLVAPRGHRSKRNGDIAFSLLSEAALCPARWRASSCRPKLGGALRAKTSQLTPAASTTCERSAMLAHPSTELVARAPCQLRHSLARSVRAARARLRQQRRLEVADKTRKRDVQTRGAAGPSRATTTLALFSQGRLLRATGVSTLYQIGCQHGATRQCWAVGWVHSPVVSMLCRS